MIKLFLFLFTVNLTRGYYISHNVKDAHESDILDKFEILIPKNEQVKDFPNEFFLDFIHLDQKIQAKFIKNSHHNEPDVYLMDSNGNPFKYDLNDAEVLLEINFQLKI